MSQRLLKDLRSRFEAKGEDDKEGSMSPGPRSTSSTPDSSPISSSPSSPVPSSLTGGTPPPLPFLSELRHVAGSSPPPRSGIVVGMSASKSIHQRALSSTGPAQKPPPPSMPKRSPSVTTILPAVTMHSVAASHAASPPTSPAPAVGAATSSSALSPDRLAFMTPIIPPPVPLHLKKPLVELPSSSPTTIRTPSGSGSFSIQYASRSDSTKFKADLKVDVSGGSICFVTDKRGQTKNESHPMMACKMKKPMRKPLELELSFVAAFGNEVQFDRYLWFKTQQERDSFYDLVLPKSYSKVPTPLVAASSLAEGQRRIAIAVAAADIEEKIAGLRPTAATRRSSNITGSGGSSGSETGSQSPVPHLSRPLSPPVSPAVSSEISSLVVETLADLDQRKLRRNHVNMRWYYNNNYFDPSGLASARTDLIKKFKKLEQQHSGQLQSALHVRDRLKGIVSEDDLNRIFEGFEELHASHKRFLTLLETLPDPSEAYLQHNQFRLYVPYATSSNTDAQCFDRVLANDKVKAVVMQVFSEESSSWLGSDSSSIFDSRLAISPLSRGGSDPSLQDGGGVAKIDLSFFASLPDARLFHYQEFIKTLSRLTPENHTYFTKVLKSVDKIDFIILDQADEELNKVRNQTKLACLREVISGSVIDLASPGRVFIREGAFKKLSSRGPIPCLKVRIFFLFNDLLVWTTPTFHFRDSLILSQAAIKDRNDLNHLAFNIVTPSRTLTIVCADTHEKLQWFYDIQTLIMGRWKPKPVSQFREEQEHRKLAKVTVRPPSDVKDVKKIHVDFSKVTTDKSPKTGIRGIPPGPPSHSSPMLLTSTNSSAVSTTMSSSAVSSSTSPSTSTSSSAASSGASSPAPSGVSGPFNFKKNISVDKDLQWSGDFEKMFQLGEKLGEGAFGAVHKAVHKTAGIEMAVKLIRKMDSDSDNEALKEEINILKQCRNTNIVAYYGCWGPDDKGRLWVLMDLCDVGSIEDLQVHTRTQFTERQVAYIMACTLRALAYLHSKRIVHRDIKGSNILLNRTGSVKLADFGVSIQHKMSTIGDVVTEDNGELVGSPLWMAPEVVKGQPIKFAADIWGLGITAIEVAEGSPPRAGMNVFAVLRAIAEEPPPLDCLSKFFWSARFRDFVSVCLNKDPEKRPTALDLLRHPFITTAPMSATCFMPVIKRFFHLKEKATIGSFDMLRGEVPLELDGGIKEQLAATSKNPSATLGMDVPHSDRKRTGSVAHADDGDEDIAEDDRGLLKDDYDPNQDFGIFDGDEPYDDEDLEKEESAAEESEISTSKEESDLMSSPAKLDSSRHGAAPRPLQRAGTAGHLPTAKSPSREDSVSDRRGSVSVSMGGTDDEGKNFSLMDEAAVVTWLVSNNFSPEARSALSGYTGNDLLDLSRQDALDLIGPTQGIRLYNRIRKHKE